MKRTTIFVSEGGILMMVREHLSKAPSGNAAQRKKMLKHGWKPEWVHEGRPMPYCLPVLGSNISLAPQFPNGVSALCAVCGNCGGSGQVHSHNPKCWDCFGLGFLINGKAWYPPCGPSGYIAGAFAYWQATGELLPSLSLGSVL